MIRRWSLFVALAVFAIALAACAERQSVTPTPIAAVTLIQTSTATPSPTQTARATPTLTLTATATPTATPTPHPLSIQFMRQKQYPGSDIVIEETLEPGSNYHRYLASYQSEGLKIYALLTVPFGEPPATGWPVIVFNHGFIPPSTYRPTERYVAYVGSLAQHGYIVFRPDYRGHGDSEGVATGGYRTPDYTIDVLNAVASIAKYPAADPERMGMWGHSMGGQITLRSMVVNCCDIKAGVIWGGVVAPYPDIMRRWRPTPTPGAATPSFRGWRSSFIAEYGTPEENPAFWAAISPNTYVAEISGPLQLHHATGDASVPHLFSEILYAEMLAAGSAVEFYSYPGDNHNLSGNFSTAMRRTIEFFDAYLKR